MPGTRADLAENCDELPREKPQMKSPHLPLTTNRYQYETVAEYDLLVPEKHASPALPVVGNLTPGASLATYRFHFDSDRSRPCPAGKSEQFCCLAIRLLRSFCRSGASRCRRAPPQSERSGLEQRMHPRPAATRCHLSSDTAVHWAVARRQRLGA